MTRFVLSSHLLSHLLRQPISKSLDRYPRTLKLRRQGWWEQKNILIGELDSHGPRALTSGTHTYSVVQSTKLWQRREKSEFSVENCLCFGRHLPCERMKQKTTKCLLDEAVQHDSCVNMTLLHLHL